MELSQGKKFEKPDAGMFLGTIIDVVEMPNIQTQYGLKNKVRIHWVLGRLDGTPVLDSENKPMTVVGIYNASISEKAELTKRIKQILGGQFPLVTNTEQLAQIIIGRSNILSLVKSENPKNPADPYTNVESIVPLAPGMLAPAIPAGFVRAKDRPKEQAGPQGQPVQTYAQPPAGQAPNNNVSFQQAPTPGTATRGF